VTRPASASMKSWLGLTANRLDPRKFPSPPRRTGKAEKIGNVTSNAWSSCQGKPSVELRAGTSWSGWQRNHLRGRMAFRLLHAQHFHVHHPVPRSGLRQWVCDRGSRELEARAVGPCITHFGDGVDCSVEPASEPKLLHHSGARRHEHNEADAVRRVTPERTPKAKSSLPFGCVNLSVPSLT
jgi:hypothetical protein